MLLQNLHILYVRLYNKNRLLEIIIILIGLICLAKRAFKIYHKKLQGASLIDVKVRMNADEEMDLLEEEFQHLNELDDHLKFYHANVSSHVAEMLIQQFKQNNQSKIRTISEFKRKVLTEFLFMLIDIKSGIFLLRDDPYKENNFILSVHHLSVTLHVKLEQIDEAFFRIGGCSLFHGLDTFVERAGLSEHASLPCRLQHFVRGEFIPSWTRRLGRTLALHELIGRAYQMEQLFNSLFYFGIDSKDSDG